MAAAASLVRRIRRWPRRRRRQGAPKKNGLIDASVDVQRARDGPMQMMNKKFKL